MQRNDGPVQENGRSGYKNDLPQRSHVREIKCFRTKIETSGNDTVCNIAKCHDYNCNRHFPGIMVQYDRKFRTL